MATNGRSITTLRQRRVIRPNKEDRIAKLEWAPDGGLGRILIDKVGLFLMGT